MKKILLSLGSIVFAGAILAGGTGAFLGDIETSTGNTFATGVIDLLVDNESYVTNNDGVLVMSTSTSWSLSSLAGKLFFNFLDLKPGDIGEDTISLHVNTNNAWACMNIAMTGTPENGQNEPETLVDPTAGTNDGELQNNLFFNFWADDGDNVYEVGEQIFKSGWAKDIFLGLNWPLADASTNIWGGSGPITANTVKYIGKAWCFGAMSTAPKTQDGQGKKTNSTNGPLVRGTGFSCAGQNVGNIVQSDGIKANVQFLVAQSRSNSAFLCSGQVAGTSTPPVSTSTLYSEDFNGCDEHDDLHNKSYGSHGNECTIYEEFWGNDTDSWTTASIKTTGYKTITLKYDRKLDDTGGPVTPLSLKVEYSVNGGSSWVAPPLETVTTESGWTTKTWNLSPSADNKASVKVRFSFVGSHSTSHGYIDNVSVTGVSI
ncbi:hypothetical protein H7X87_02275 [Acetobacteraceae bacterium]|nr:hypothetical protein [Candidatus Parcubacteria bacterium]